MNHEDAIARLEAVVAALPKKRIVRFEKGEPISDEDREVVEVVGAKPLPAPVMELLKALNGVNLVWQAELAGQRVQGSLNILPYREAVLRASANFGGEPLEGVLWDAEYPEGVRKQLQAMTIFEEIAGRSANLAYASDDPRARLVEVEETTITPIVPDFGTVVDLLLCFAGANPLRAALTVDDWRNVVDRDPVLAEIRALG